MPNKICFGDQMNLGQLIDALEIAKPDEPVRFTVGYLCPEGAHSYRGFYEDLAIGYGQDERLVGDFLNTLNEVVGKEFYGWKGGTYRMDRDTPVWVANSDEAPSTAIIGVDLTEYDVILKTAYIDL